MFTFRPRHDLIQQAFHFGRSLVDVHYRQVDSLELDFRLTPGTAPECVWAIVAKDELLSIKDDRWDLVRLSSPTCCFLVLFFPLDFYANH